MSLWEGLAAKVVETLSLCKSQAVVIGPVEISRNCLVPPTMT
jgi:hypothetical protein